MKINALGHVVLKVSDLARAEAFYQGVLGLPVCAHYDGDGGQMTFFTLGNHHDFAILEVSGDGGKSSKKEVGLDHVAFSIGTSLDELREAHAYLTEQGITTTPIDHEVTKSLYMSDPDGNGIELYIDASDVWRKEPAKVAQSVPLEL